ncbi:hypothetical protein EUTSA_v10002915mg [Eutrema salsugineum]|uniref:F-box associated beta-propeller type 1 domain-containing protein n=1 Tax=Eutrema salsugineum TaxID=72664 RepID=V4L4R4_EUTSA|nr:hypothetical protein EUTSA_v10002915mg [Eutrema salsugineum]
MTYDFPADLVEEILSRVLATSETITIYLQRKKHFGKAPKQSCVLMLKENKICSLNIDLDNVPPSIKFKGALDLKDSHSNSEQVDLLEVFHCDGLLLCTTLDNKPMVFNPCLGETRWIKLEIGDMIHSTFALGYTNKTTCRSYKILRHWVCYETNDRDFGFDIYYFTSDSWRVLNAPNVSFKITCPGVSLKGNTYWLAGDDINHMFLLSFDFTSESFRSLNIPSPLSLHRGCLKLSVVREEELSVLTNPSSYISVDTSLLIDEEKKVALCCSFRGGNKVYVFGKDGEFYTETPVQEYKNKLLSYLCCPLIFDYVPSLVPIQ